MHGLSPSSCPFSSQSETVSSPIQAVGDTSGLEYRVLQVTDPSDEVILRNLGIEHPTALMKHTLYFADHRTGLFTVESIHAAFKAIGVKHPQLKTDIIFSILLPRIGPEMHIRNIHQAIHSELDSGTFNLDGSINSDKLQALFALSLDGSFTKVDFQIMREERKADHPSRPCSLYHFLSQIVAEKASKGEFDLLIEIASDCKRGGERAISLQRMNYFYHNGSLLFRHIARQ